MAWKNVPLKHHPLKGVSLIYRPDISPEPPEDWTPNTVIAPGMTIEILEVFRHWNGNTGSNVCYGRCEQTGITTHLSFTEIGI
jgi:hypothetical protein